MNRLNLATFLASGAAATLLLATPAFAAKAPQVDVCHPAGNSGQVLTLNVNGNALSAHLGHGDWLPIDFYADADADGFGDDGDVATLCEQPAGTSTVGGDCDDGNANTYPGAVEICDGLDNDCDGQVPADETDDDGDGVSECEGDCDDADVDNSPLNAEVCDGQDNDCDGSIDEGFDLDLDSFTSCDGDCNDFDDTINPLAPEVCGDGIDNDCDGVDEDCVGEPITGLNEAYGHHGACSGWNGCGDAATCALWACVIEGYGGVVSYGEDKPCTQFDVCHLFYNQNQIQYNWGNWCDVRGVTDIVCE